MKVACGIDYAEAIKSTTWIMVRDVRIPFASPALLPRTKKTYRDKDAADRAFLQDLINQQGQKSG
jgi:hypothetical protein